MSLSTAPALVGKVAIPAAIGAVETIAEGLDFANLLGRSDASEREPQRASHDRSFVSILGSGPDTAAWTKQLHEAVETLNGFLAQFRGGQQGIEIRGDGAGGLVVDADSETRAAIEQQLQRDPSLAQSFHQIFAALFKLDPIASNAAHPNLRVESVDEFAAVGRGDKSPNPIALSLSQRNGQLTARID